MSPFPFPIPPDAEPLWQQCQRIGAQTTVNPDFQSNYLVDFSITGLLNVHAHVNLGLHVTSTHDDINAMKRFLNGANRGIVHKALYIEVDSSIAQSGGPVVALGSAISFLFERSKESIRSLGLRIFEDCSTHFFSLEDTIIRLERLNVDEFFSIGDSLLGRITHYFVDRGFGFIQSNEERKFFLHIANIVDDDLRALLADYSLGQTIPVEFQFGGSEGGKYPKAINIVMTK